MRGKEDIARAITPTAERQKCTTLVLHHVYSHTYLMLSTFTLATVTQLLAAELMLQPHSKGSKLGNHIQ